MSQNQTTYVYHMTKEQLAASLDGCQYREEMDGGFEKAAKAAGLIVVFGASDNLMEFRGAVNDELGAWNGATALFYHNGKRWEVTPNDMEAIRDMEDDSDMIAAAVAYKQARNLVMITPGKDCQFDVHTELPHAKFDVMEEDDLYCRGVVIDVKDLS